MRIAQFPGEPGNPAITRKQLVRRLDYSLTHTARVRCQYAVPIRNRCHQMAYLIAAPPPPGVMIVMSRMMTSELLPGFVATCPAEVFQGFGVPCDYAETGATPVTSRVSIWRAGRYSGSGSRRHCRVEGNRQIRAQTCHQTIGACALLLSAPPPESKAGKPLSPPARIPRWCYHA